MTALRCSHPARCPLEDDVDRATDVSLAILFRPRCTDWKCMAGMRHLTAHGCDLNPGEANRVERVERIELSSLAWKAIALPLSYTRAVTR